MVAIIINRISRSSNSASLGTFMILLGMITTMRRTSPNNSMSSDTTANNINLLAPPEM